MARNIKSNKMWDDLMAYAIKPKSKSTDRHARETLDIIAKKPLIHMNRESLRQGIIIRNNAPPEVIELYKQEKISTWKAYQLTKIWMGMHKGEVPCSVTIHVEEVK